MGVINWNGYVKMYNTDYQKIQLCRITESSYCQICRSHISKGSYCLGKGGEKFCLNCSDKLFEDVENEINKFLKVMIATKEDIKKNKDKYKTNNMISNI